MVSIFLENLGTVMLWNFFARTTKDVSDRVITNLLNVINSQNIAGLLAGWDTRHTKTISPTHSIPHTTTIPTHGSTKE